MPTLFISDLHLSPERPAITALFERFLTHASNGAEALYILGDLFEYWAGDDDLTDPFNARIVAALARTAGRVRLYVMHGNRDFLLGAAFCHASGAQLLPDPSVVTLHGTPTLLMHGDTLCTDDTDYQRFRAQVRNTRWQTDFLAQPLAVRKAQIAALRAKSETEKAGKPAAIMDVNPQAVAAALHRHATPRLIHGHTHRPGHHTHQVDDMLCERWVLPDWYEQGGYLRCDPSGCSLHVLTL
ncbi:UDP-2,3-diacylglucosamine diphosphatase [Thiobacter aerophilum]|uniref:UDP-2,3-diacylglucosamine hydrolase n=1 Tax=Thiobacter aerophilum TaxID=3121275 RepID=A0ABV0EBS5_9BURK